MDGESAEEPVRSHTRRLNVQFEDERAPALDDVTRIEEMRRAATNYDFKVPDLSHNQDSIIPPVSDGILEIALRIHASLFFFEPKSIRDIIDGGVRDQARKGGLSERDNSVAEVGRGRLLSVG